MISTLDKNSVEDNNYAMDIFSIVNTFGLVLDLLGVIVMVLGVFVCTILFVSKWAHDGSIQPSYKAYRRNMGRVILIGLEILVAGDIIRSVAGQPTFTSVGILAIIVLVRSFLSITFEMEVDGKWPWDKTNR